MTVRHHRRLAAALAVLLALGLGACGDDSDDATTQADGSETTETTETTETETTETTVADESADGDAAGEVTAKVFDSSVAFDEKAALIEGGEAHRGDHDGYVTAAQQVGGITLEPTDVAVAGDTATVTYRILFGGNEAYADLSMDVTRVDDGWIVPTDAFCGFLASARTPCAAG